MPRKEAANSDSSPDESGRLIIVSNRLPVSIQRSRQGYQTTASAGGLATSLSSLGQQRPMLWLGWPGIDPPDAEAQTQIETRLRDEFGCLPIFLPKRTFEAYYQGFSNGCLWPLFHYFPQHVHYDAGEWDAYLDINRRFRDRLLPVMQPGDRVWIHDYHLMVLPELVRRERPDAAIAFFLHIPFPSYEILRYLPWREEIVRGLLGADLIGFHTFSYARHYLSSLLRLAGLEHDFGRVSLPGRTVKVDAFPLGIDVGLFAAAGDRPAVRRQLADLGHKLEGQKVILSVDRLDFTKGIPERLRAFDRFLDEHRSWRGRVTLIALCVPSRTRVPAYGALKREIDELIGRINGRHGQPGWTPILYLYRQLSFERLVPLYLLADVALVTPLRDGMNLVAKEYLASRRDGSGVLILSETAGSAEELGEAIIVNPHDESAMVAALERALSLTPQEQRERNRPMVERLRRYDTARWANDILSGLDDLRREPAQGRPRPLRGDLLETLVRKYRSAHRRLLLFDYDGTLVPLRGQPKQAKPNPDLVQRLRRLAGEPENTVVVVSGRSAETLDDWLGDVGLYLVAEHGGRSRGPGSDTWVDAEAEVPEGWKDQLRPLFQLFTDRTPGSEIEEKIQSLAWHHRRAEPELGSLRAKELTDTLEGYVANTPLQILQGDRVVEVKPSGVSKGRAVQPWIAAQPPPDFLLALGDDVTDEDLFAALPETGWGIKVGRADRSSAGYSLPGVEEVRDLLRQLAEG